jgi:GTP-binding protein Era
VTFGFCALTGRPNVGKSTLVNALVGSKVAITSPVAQTTRSAIRAIVNRPADPVPHAEFDQLVLVDTPGIHKPVTLLGERLNDIARAQLSEVDLVCFVVDAASGIGRGDELLASWLPSSTPVVCVLNKIDACDATRIAEQLSAAMTLRDFDAYVPLSAETGDGCGILVDELFARLPEGAPMFPADMTTDQTERHLAAELLREQLLRRTHDEVPHSVAVFIEEIEGLDAETTESSGTVRIDAIVYVERDSQKGIVIGKGGVTLRDAGTAARHQLEALLGRRVYLQTRVKVSPKWQRRAEQLNRLGY